MHLILMRISRLAQTRMFCSFQVYFLVMQLSLCTALYCSATIQTSCLLLLKWILWIGVVHSEWMKSCFSSLGESIAANNAYRQRESELSVKRVAVQEVPPSTVLDSSSGSSRSIHSLVEKIQNGLEVQNVSVCRYCRVLYFTPLLAYYYHHRSRNVLFLWRPSVVVYSCRNTWRTHTCPTSSTFMNTSSLHSRWVHVSAESQLDVSDAGRELDNNQSSKNLKTLQIFVNAVWRCESYDWRTCFDTVVKGNSVTELLFFTWVSWECYTSYNFYLTSSLREMFSFHG